MKEAIEKDSKKLDEAVSSKLGKTVSDAGKKKVKEEKPPTKVVVRRLPPSMTEEEFVQQIEPLPPIDYMYYVPADMSLSPHCFCRAYLNFVNQADIFIFTQKFDGYVFVDSKGLEYPAVVEFAPFQRIPKLRAGKKKDSKAGTIDSDPIFSSFLEKLNTQNQENTFTGTNVKQHFFETSVSANEENKVSSTPLLDYLRNRHAERLKAREEKRKKDMERKRARDEQRRSAKKAEEEPAVLKVLSNQSTNLKDKLKEKDSIKPVKRRDDRIKEQKGRIGKSYMEEKLKQLDKREELKKKYSSSCTDNKSSKSSDKILIDLKEKDRGHSEVEKNEGLDSKKVECDEKSYESLKKDYSSGKKSYQHNNSYDYNRRDDDKRKFRDSDRLNRSRDHHENKDDRFRINKKNSSENKRSYSRYDDHCKDKCKREAYNSKNSINRKIDKVTKYEKVASDVADHDDKTGENNCLESDDNSTSKLKFFAVEDITNKLSNETGDVSEDKIKSVNKVSLSSEEPKTCCELSEKTFISLTSTSDEKNSVENQLCCPKPLKTNNCNESLVKLDEISLEVSNTHVSEDISEELCINSETVKDINEVCSSVMKRRNSMEMYDKKSDFSDKNRRENGRRSSLESGDQHPNSKPIDDVNEERFKKHDVRSGSKRPKDPRTERRIRNKDRPSMEIYRPGMGKFSKQRLEREKVLGSSTEVDSNSPSPSPTFVHKNKVQ